MGLFGKSKRELLEWQNLIVANPTNRLVMTENQLKAASQRMAANHLRILKESAELCNTTKKPDVFFSRYDLLVEVGRKLVELSKYVRFTGTSPAAALNQVLREKPEATRGLIDRCLEDVAGLKTAASRSKRCQKMLRDFIPYKDQVEEENWTYLEEMCVKEITAAADSERSGKTKRMISLIEGLNEFAVKARELIGCPYDLTINYAYTDPDRTKVEAQPLTSTGKEPKYPAKFHYDGKPEQEIWNFGDAWLFKDGSIGKGRMIKWFDKKGVMIHLAIINGVLGIQKIETTDAPGNWKTVYKAE